MDRDIKIPLAAADPAREQGEPGSRGRKIGDLPRPATTVGQRILWLYAFPIGLFHLLACLAFVPWLFDWRAVIVTIAGVFFFGQGINLCYHRLLTHRSLKLPKWLERAFVVVAICCMQDTPGKWVTTHRIHHKYSDQPQDPHSPLVTAFWGHCGWLFRHNTATQTIAAYHRYARDILEDPFYLRLEKKVLLGPAIYSAHAALFFAAGLAIGWAETGDVSAGLQFGLSLLIWGIFLRTVIVWHITWSVNSLTHMFGYRNYETNDDSRNNWLVGLIGVGEGWHNNHHHDQASATTQHKWWEIDMTYYLIKLLEWVGLATEVVAPRHRRRASMGVDS